MIDYKFHEMVDNGADISVTYRIYEGAITTENEFDILKGKDVPIKRYRRTAMLGEKTAVYLKSDDIRQKLNLVLDAEATKRGDVVIDEQKNAPS